MGYPDGMSATDRLYDTFGAGSAGNDLARADGNVDDFFVHTDQIRYFLSRDPAYPFVVGPKGTGKSLLLFKKLLAARELSGVIVLPRPPQRAFTPAFDFAEVATWSAFWRLLKDDRPDLQAWGNIWEWAILRTVLGGWLAHDRQKPTERLAELEELTEGVDDADPYDLISQYLQVLEGGQGLAHGRRVLPSAQKLRRFLVRHGNEYPPTFFFLDNHDEVFEQQPDFWKASAYGAFLAIQSIQERSNRRLHGFLSLRPEVISELQKSESLSQWTPDIFRITWEDDKLMELFALRAARLKRELLRSPELAESAPVAALLGRDLIPPGGDRPVLRNLRIEDGEDPVYEDAESYILRHTLRRPRDLILMGNEILLYPKSGEDWSNARRVRGAVDRAAQIICSAYLSETRHRWPWGTQGPTSLVEFIRRFVRRNIISRREAHAIEQQFCTLLGPGVEEARPFRELATLGLFGYTVQNPHGRAGAVMQKFQMPGATSIDLLPETADWLLVHPVLYGEPFHIEVVRGQVIGPRLPFDVTRFAPPPPTSVTEPKVQDARASSPSFDGGEATGEWAVADVKRPPSQDAAYTWVHLSDAHFGAGNAAHRFDQRDVMRAILRDLRDHAPKRPDAIFFTGDIAFSAAAAQYKEAWSWIGQVVTAAQTDAGRVRLVPGNHDVDRVRAERVGVADAHRVLRERPARLDDYLDDSSEWERLVGKLNEYRSFVNQFSGHPQPYNGVDWVEALAPNPGRHGAIRVIGLSTVWVSDVADGRGGASLDVFSSNLLLSRGQISRTLGEAERGELVLLLSHHPPEWLHEDCRAWLEEALAPLAHVHLAGHVHRARTRVQRAIGVEGQSVRYVAGAAHGDPADERCHGYAWGAVRWVPERQLWQVGWAPRTFVDGKMRPDRTRYDLDMSGFAWQDLAIPWPDPNRIVRLSRPAP